MKNRFAFLKTLAAMPPHLRLGTGTLALATLSLLYSLTTTLLDPVWQQWAFLAVSILVLIAAGIAYAWLREGRLRLAGWLLLSAVLVLAAALVTLYTDMTILAALIAGVYALLLAPITLPRREIAPALFLGLIFGSGIYIFDFFNPLQRTTPIGPGVAWTLAALLVVWYVLTLARQFPALDLRTKFMFSTLLGAAIIITSLITYFINSNTAYTTQAARQQLNAAAIQTAQEIDAFMNSTLELARTASVLPDIQDYTREEQHKAEDTAQVTALLEHLRATNPAFIHSYTLVDFRGNLLARAPEGVQRDAYYETLDTSYALRAQLENAFITPIETPPNGRSTIGFVVRVGGKDNRAAGALIVRYNSDILQDILAQRNDTAGPQSFAVLVDNNQIILAHGLQPQKRLQTLSGLTGIPPLELRDLPFRTFTRLPLAGGPASVEDVVAVHSTNSRPWQVLFAQPEATFLAPVRTQARTSGTISLLFLAGVAVGAFVLTNYLVRPLGTLTQTAEKIAAGDLAARAPVFSDDEFGTLARTFNKTAAQLQETLNSLEQQVRQRTAALETRARYLRVSAEVTAAISTTLNMDALIQQVVNTIRLRLDLYYVGIFLLDATGEWAILRAGTGVAGEKMSARGHRIKVGSGMIGWSILHQKPRIAQIAGEDVVRLTAPELPLTRSEAALPLASRGRVLGALTVQSTQPDAFDEDILAILQIMANQVAVALDNARLFDESQRALQAARRAFGDFTRQAWHEMLRTRPHWGYRYQDGRLSPVSGAWPQEMRRTLKEGRSFHRRAPDGPVLTIPLRVRGNAIGGLQFRKPPQALDWSADEIETLERLSEQMALALDNARLYEESQQRAFQEQVRGEIVSRVRQQNNLEQVLDAAAQEIYAALALEEITIQLVPPDTREASAHD